MFDVSNVKKSIDISILVLLVFSITKMLTIWFVGLGFVKNCSQPCKLCNRPIMTSQDFFLKKDIPVRENQSLKSMGKGLKAYNAMADFLWLENFDGNGWKNRQASFQVPAWAWECWGDYCRNSTVLQIIEAAFQCSVRGWGEGWIMWIMDNVQQSWRVG